MIARIQSFLAKVRALAGRIIRSRPVRSCAYPLLMLLAVLLASPWLALLARALVWGSATDQQTAITLVAAMWAVRETVRRWRRQGAPRQAGKRGSESRRAHDGPAKGRKRTGRTNSRHGSAGRAK